MAMSTEEDDIKCRGRGEHAQIITVVWCLDTRMNSVVVHTHLTLSFQSNLRTPKKRVFASESQGPVLYTSSNDTTSEMYEKEEEGVRVSCERIR